MDAPGDITILLSEIRSGSRDAELELVTLVYDELRRLAAHYMRRERPDHTLQATALVHEAYVRLAKQREVTWQNRAHFFAIAGKLMRRILVDHARTRSRQKRGGDRIEISLEDLPLISEKQSEGLVELDTALRRLEEEYPRQSQIVELRFFGGLSIDEIAEVLTISPKTVKRDWSVARAWLHREIRRGESQ